LAPLYIPTDVLISLEGSDWKDILVPELPINKFVLYAITIEDPAP
jgi:hypothetical protein